MNEYLSLLRFSAINAGAYEKVCLLFNIAALMSQIAEVHNHESDDGLKASAKFFQVHFSVDLNQIE